MTITEDPFATTADVKPTTETKTYGHVYRGRYHMPRHEHDIPKKGAVPWEPRGMMRATNLVGAFSESRALNIWEQEQALIGLALSPALYEELVVEIHRARREGVDFSRLRDFPSLRLFLSGAPSQEERSIIGRAKHHAGANEGRDSGTNRHSAWEHRGKTGELIGTPAMREQILAAESLLLAARLERVPGLSERVIRNDAVRCAGKFDDVVRHMDTGESFICDYKSKSRRFFSWLEVDAQLAIYARAEWMLHEEYGTYVPGPNGRVNMEKGVVLHVPSDGSAPSLRRADLVTGWRVAQLARQVVDERAYGTSVERDALSLWGSGVDIRA